MSASRAINSLSWPAPFDEPVDCTPHAITVRYLQYAIDQLHVTERYTRDSYDTIRYEVTMEDPEVFTKPWHQVETFRLRPNERLREYECIENNEDLLRFEKLLETDPTLRKP